MFIHRYNGCSKGVKYSEIEIASQVGTSCPTFEDGKRLHNINFVLPLVEMKAIQYLENRYQACKNDSQKLKQEIPSTLQIRNHPIIMSN